MSLFSASFFSSVSWVTSDFLPPFLGQSKIKKKLVASSLYHAVSTTPRPPGAGGESAGGCDGPIFLVYLGYSLWEISSFPV